MLEFLAIMGVGATFVIPWAIYVTRPRSRSYIPIASAPSHYDAHSDVTVSDYAGMDAADRPLPSDMYRKGRQHR